MIGGTSAVAPLWAGLIAVAYEKNGKNPLVLSNQPFMPLKAKAPSAT